MDTLEEVSTLSKLLNEKEVAALLSISVFTVQQWRMRGGGPSFVKAGRCVRYRPTDVEGWINKNLVPHTSASHAD